ncbi:MAG: hypothetical protein COT74_06425 [Bdellovibrionales bacterium CG10_big_fil_rev_8_21_14_0_10_45_34]|nr:MAG: hypothetical protein COT74_06425 [Bdellovibrionales bacterium CG10_big_fil_rev_8_21_14_0_10_45_34]
MKFFIRLFLLIVILLRAGSVMSQAAPQIVSPPPPPPVNQDSSLTNVLENPETMAVDKVDLLKGIIEDFDYDPEGKRDPFSVYNPIGIAGSTGTSAFGPVFPLQRFDLDQLHVTGIIWNVKSPRALVVDPQSKSYTLRMNDMVGRNNGRVVAIREGEVVVMEAVEIDGQLAYQPRILKIYRPPEKKGP